MDIRQDNDSFIQYFGLRHNPFGSASSFQFYRSRRREVLEQLLHFSRYSQLVLVVTGPRGSGKTVLRHAMAAAGKETAVNVVVSALKNSDAAGIAQQMAYALQSTNADIMSLLHAVEQSVLSGKDVQLLVDDAEALDGSALALLQRLAGGSNSVRCKVFLFGEPALQTALHDMAGKDDGLEYHLIELEPWLEEEVEEYLQLRLQSAGQDLDLFTDQELAILLEQGQGWPGVINQLAQELLLARMQGKQEVPLQQEQPVRPPLPYRHLAALLVVAFLFIVVWYLLDDSKEQQSEPAQAQVPDSGVNARQAVGQVTGTSAGAQQRIMLDLPTADRAAGQEQQETTKRAVEPAVASAPTTTVTGTQGEPAMAQPTAEKIAPAAPVQESRPAARQAVKPAAPGPAKPAEQTRPKVAATVAARKAANGDVWYAGQPAQAYTLQLFATASEQKARQFVQANGSQFQYFRKVHQGQSLFVVTHGRFDSIESARSAIARLPESLRANKPWPRTFASIRQEMR